MKINLPGRYILEIGLVVIRLIVVALLVVGYYFWQHEGAKSLFEIVLSFVVVCVVAGICVLELLKMWWIIHRRRNAHRELNRHNFTIAVLLSSTLAMLPTQGMAVDASTTSGYETRTTTVLVPVPLPGQPIILPDTVPVELRAQAIRILEQTAPGEKVVIAASELAQSQPELLTAVASAYGAVKILTNEAANTPKVVALPTCIFWILVVIAIIVMGFIVYILYKICCDALKKIPSPKTNTVDSVMMPPLVAGDVGMLPAAFDLQSSTNIAGGWSSILSIMITTNSKPLGISVSVNKDGYPLCGVDGVSLINDIELTNGLCVTNSVRPGTNSGSVMLPWSENFIFRLRQVAPVAQ